MSYTLRIAIMDTTLTVRLDPKLKADAESTLDAMGMTMSIAVRMFLTQVVLQKRLPFQVQVEPPALNAPPEIAAEIVLEILASLTASLDGLAAAATTPERRAEIDRVREVLLEKRFSFDPHDAQQVRAVLHEVSGYANSFGATASMPQ